jgi:hypothetical protein
MLLYISAPPYVCLWQGFAEVALGIGPCANRIIGWQAPRSSRSDLRHRLEPVATLFRFRLHRSKQFMRQAGSQGRDHSPLRSQPPNTSRSDTPTGWRLPALTL